MINVNDCIKANICVKVDSEYIFKTVPLVVISCDFGYLECEDNYQKKHIVFYSDVVKVFDKNKLIKTSIKPINNPLESINLKLNNSLNLSQIKTLKKSKKKYLGSNKNQVLEQSNTLF